MLKHGIRKFFVLLLMLFAWSPAFSGAQAQPQQSAFNEWVTYYYFTKDSSRVPEFLQWLDKAKIIEGEPASEPPIEAFLSVLFADNIPQIPYWLQNVALGDKTRITIENALWRAGQDAIVKTIFGETGDTMVSSPMPLSQIPIRQPSDLDMMWGAFFASGDELYVKRIIAVLDGTPSSGGNDSDEFAVHASAAWSLKSNIVQHELVDRIVRKELVDGTPSVKAKLQEIIAGIERQRRPLPVGDGDFSAMLLITDESALSEYAKSPSETMSFQELAKARRGDVVAAKIVFSGMALTDDMLANVTFDLKILGPDGSVYDGTDLQNVEALVRRVPKRFAVFDNRTFLKIHFVPTDQLGTYRFVARLRDNIAHKSLRLEKSVALEQ